MVCGGVLMFGENKMYLSIKSEDYSVEAIEEIIGRLFEKEAYPFSEINLENLRGLGTHSRESPFGFSYFGGPPQDDYNFIIDPLFLATGDFHPLNPKIELGEDVHLLLYFNTLKVAHYHPLEERVKRKWGFGPVISRELYVKYERLSVETMERKEPQARLISSEQEFIPLYEEDFQRVMELEEKYSQK